MPRPRKSIDELKASGTYRPSRHGHREKPVPAAAGDGPLPPKADPGTTPADVAGVRSELVALLGPRLTTQDGILLDELAERVVEVRRLREAIRTAAPGTLGYSRINSALSSATAALDRLCDRFGLNPAARTSLPVPQPAHALPETWRN